MSNHSSPHRETVTPESSLGLNLLVGTPVFCALVFVLLAVGWAISEGSPAFSPSLWIHLWWLASVRLLRDVFALMLVGAIYGGCFLITLALGGRAVAVWRRLRHAR
ncbi:hypothetical protein AB7849_18775 [Rhodanobacter sp. 115]|uniref:hypothetical protein n=1 Tax=Rhodanobacter sp. FW021-MT20 TaxID=1162282 RepID=UPI000260FCF8|nr:hypothetical protein [Rhodanobacter sp. 115]EIL89196.1 hypothetical protein UU5_15970 [Rhodanobacter sp. 115]